MCFSVSVIVPLQRVANVTDCIVLHVNLVGNHNAAIESAPANQGFPQTIELHSFKPTIDKWDHSW